MYDEYLKLLLYSNIDKDSVFMGICDIYKDWKNGFENKNELIHRVYTEIKKLLDVSTELGFDGNLWHNYIAYLIMTNENSFSLTCERLGPGDGSVNILAKNDYKVFKRIFDFDFKPLENDLGIDCFSIITNYTAISKRENVYNKAVSQVVRDISQKIEQAADENDIFKIITGFYKE